MMFAGPVRSSLASPVTQHYLEELHTMSFRFVSTTHVRNRVARALTCLALAAVAFLPAARASAQTNTGSVRGADGAPVSDVTVTAVDSSTSLTRNAITNAQGFYSLNALRPASYTASARRIGFQPMTKRIQVQVGQVLSSDFSLTASAQQLAAVTVTAQNAAVETRSSEASTNISQQQINQLPTSSRNTDPTSVA
jgi:hypothetical protein